MYKIVRHRFNGRPRTVETGLTLEQAQEHCSSTMTHGLFRKGRLRRGMGRCDDHGVQSGERCPICDGHLFHDWFDGYEET